MKLCYPNVYLFLSDIFNPVYLLSFNNLPKHAFSTLFYTFASFYISFIKASKGSISSTLSASTLSPYRPYNCYSFYSLSSCYIKYFSSSLWVDYLFSWLFETNWFSDDNGLLYFAEANRWKFSILIFYTKVYIFKPKLKLKIKSQV